METETPPSRFLLLTYPRTASNLLIKILSLWDQPNAAFRSKGGYFFIPALAAGYRLQTREKNIDFWNPEQVVGMMQAYQKSFNALEEHLQMAQANGQMAFVKEHIMFMADPVAKSKLVFGEGMTGQQPWTVQVPSYYTTNPTHSASNITVLPDEFLDTCRPIFLIRHPALAFPSQLRTIVDNEGADAARNEVDLLPIEQTLSWTAQLWNWYKQRNTGPDQNGVSWPVILDADDIMTKPEVVQRLCTITGLDPDRLRFDWAPASADELAENEPYENRMLSTLSASSGIVHGLTSGSTDIDVEVAKWRAEFGEVLAAKMEECVRAAMPDYERLKELRLRA